MKTTEKESLDPTKKAEQTKVAGEPAGDVTQDPEKDSEQENTEPGQDSPEPQEEEQPEKEEPTPAEEPEPAEPASADAEKEQLKAELLESRSQIAAYAAGVAPEMVADAVILATAEAKAAGEVTEEAVAKAMNNVLKRHPEWKTKPSAGAKKTTGGFRMGADPDGGSERGKESSAEKGAKKPWNKFNR